MNDTNLGRYIYTTRVILKSYNLIYNKFFDI